MFCTLFPYCIWPNYVLDSIPMVVRVWKTNLSFLDVHFSRATMLALGCWKLWLTEKREVSLKWACQYCWHTVDGSFIHPKQPPFGCRKPMVNFGDKGSVIYLSVAVKMAEPRFFWESPTPKCVCHPTNILGIAGNTWMSQEASKWFVNGF